MIVAAFSSSSSSVHGCGCMCAVVGTIDFDKWSHMISKVVKWEMETEWTEHRHS